MSIATSFALQGYWLVLPFAGLEMLVLGIALYVCAVRAKQYELISVQDGSVDVERGRNHRSEHYHFDRYWVQVLLVRPSNNSQTSRLFIRSHGSGIEIGACLNEQERQTLASGLKRVIGHSAR